MATQPSDLCRLLLAQLVDAQNRDSQIKLNNLKGAGIEVPTTGTVLSTAYEQLRNAAEYSEEHLLLQRAIKRFCRLNLVITKRSTDNLAQELVVELVQAGYLHGGPISTATIMKLNDIIRRYVALYGQLRQAHVTRDTAANWMLAFISVEAENLLTPHSQQPVVVFVAYQYFLQVIDRDQFLDLAESDNYEICLYIAAHKAILKSDIDIVRHQLFDMYQLSNEDARGFKEFNERVDKLYSTELTRRLERIVSRYGAPFRVLKSLIDDRTDVPRLLKDNDAFMVAYRSQIRNEYKQVGKRLNRGLIKSIIFIIITKVLIGVGIEVPYDILVHGSVIILPLVVNLVFPPLYMATLKLNLISPSSANAQTVANYMENVLYGKKTVTVITPRTRRQGSVTRLLYALFFFIPIGLTVFVLQRIGFNLMQMCIFFIFFSTASFLGFRLGTMVRELELTIRQTGFLASLRDFFYLPFIVAGQWLSAKYGRINLIGRVLDIAIELPLKALLRLIRQWIRFLNEKRDELY